MQIGSIVYATKSGLGKLARLLYTGGIIDKVMLAEHDTFESHPEWYNSQDIYVAREFFLRDIDVLFLLEAPCPNPYNWELVIQAKQLGKKVVLMPMYESTPRSSLFLVDKFICPSELDLKYYDENKSVVLPVPSDPSVTWRKRKVAEKFIHNAGHGGIFRRNGTMELLEAMQYVKSPIKLDVRVQPDAKREVLDALKCDDDRVSIVKKHIPFDQLWSEGDVFIFPEKFNGLSLPLQEAHAAGMCVMAGDRFPINLWLPREPLIPTSGKFNLGLPWIGITIDADIIEPKKIAETIDAWYGKDISDLSERGRQWAADHTADKLRDRYRSELCG